MQVQLWPEDQSNPKFVDIADDGIDQLRDLQALVHGYVEMVHTAALDRVKNVVLCDEDARIKGAKPNYKATTAVGFAATLYGPIVVCGINPAGSKWTSINKTMEEARNA